jgi:signal recognition particle GTPase
MTTSAAMPNPVGCGGKSGRSGSPLAGLGVSPVGVLTFGTRHNKDGVGFMGWFQRLSEGLTKTRSVMRGSLDRLLGRAVDPALLDEFEAALITSDLGAAVAERVISRLK